jgi:hypothetical protein
LLIRHKSWKKVLFDGSLWIFKEGKIFAMNKVENFFCDQAREKWLKNESIKGVFRLISFLSTLRDTTNGQKRGEKIAWAAKERLNIEMGNNIKWYDVRLI